jgi:wyosine [tRNA(Phe)-imidazoG37] synthetase (radical SAM superfamily)
LSEAFRVPERAHFSVPESAARVILSELERGAPVDALVFGGPGEPLRHRGIGSILRRLRSAAHVRTVLLTDGTLLGDRSVRRDASEADLLVVWVPALEDRSAAGGSRVRREAYDRHVEGIAAFRRETKGRVALELPVRPGANDFEASRAAWKRTVETVRPERVFVIPAPGVSGEAVSDALESVRASVHPRAGAFLLDATMIDRRCFDPSS